MAASQPYFRTDTGPGRTVYYGPFGSEREAMLASIFSRSDAEMAAASKKRKAMEVYAAEGVEFYEPDELSFLVMDPGSSGFKSVKVKPAGDLKLHSDWNGRDLEFYANYYLPTTQERP